MGNHPSGLVEYYYSPLKVNSFFTHPTHNNKKKLKHLDFIESQYKFSPFYFFQQIYNLILQTLLL